MTIILLIIGISVLILVHEFGHFLAAKKFGLLVEEFGIGFPPRLFKWKSGETVWSVNALPFGGFVKIHGEKKEDEKSEEMKKRSFWFLKPWKRAIILAAGVLMNFILGWIMISIIYMIGAPSSVMINNVLADTPAVAAGLMKSDRVIGYEKVNDFINFVNENKGKEITLKVLRGNETKEIKVIPRANPPEGQGALGIALNEMGLPQLGFFESIWQGLKTSVNIIGAIFVALANLFAGIFTGGAVLENFVGPVGIFEIANQSAQFGLVYLLQLIALISLNLAVLNVLPIPALDGGRLFFLLIEKIKGSPVSSNKENWAHAIGFILLILLMVVITVRDVARLF